MLIRLTICSLCILTICNIVISRFGFKGWIWVLTASVPDFCIPFTFQYQIKVILFIIYFGGNYVNFIMCL